MISLPVLRTLPDFFSPGECVEWIALAEARGFDDAPITTAAGFVRAPHIRNNTRVMLDDTTLADALWRRLAPHVAAEDEPGERWAPVGVNERLRFYRYEPGQVFRWHRDGAFWRNDDEGSRLTFMVYLNDDFEGGETEFEDERVVPRTGSALLFSHYLRHQGATVTRGVKYVLRSDVMYRVEGA